MADTQNITKREFVSEHHLLPFDMIEILNFFFYFAEACALLYW